MEATLRHCHVAERPVGDRIESYLLVGLVASSVRKRLPVLDWLSSHRTWTAIVLQDQTFRINAYMLIHVACVLVRVYITLFV